MRIFKGSKKEFRCLEVALTNKKVFYPQSFGNSNDHRHPIYIAWERKGHKIWFKGVKKEFRRSKVAYK